MIGHGNIWFIGIRYASESEYLVKCLMQSICIGAVNGFVLISGWFGIRSKLSKIGDLMFMLLFCTVPILVIALIIHWISPANIMSQEGLYLYLLGGDNYWFVVDYIGLLIISPLLNTGFESLKHRQIKTILIVGYGLIAFYDFILRTDVLGAAGGYSVLWFVYLYLLARYMRIYGIKYINNHKWLFLILSIITQTILFYKGYIGLRYTNPLILLEAICLILIFNKWEFQNKFINHISRASLMAYLLHMQPILTPHFGHYLFYQYQTLGYWMYLMEVIILALIVFLIAYPINIIQSKTYLFLQSRFKSLNLFTR